MAPLPGLRFRRRWHYKPLTWLILATLLFFLCTQLPAPPKTQNNTGMDRPPPQYEVASKPRFLYRSVFRERPDHGYEEEMDEALKRIEERARRTNNDKENNKYNKYNEEGNVEVIWQVMLGLERGSDSTAFERVNAEWEYKGCLHLTLSHMLVTPSSATSFIENTFNTDLPDLLRLYKSYPHDVLRADLLRYLLLWYYGGYYADMDVYPARPIKSCPALGPVFSSTSRPPSLSKTTTTDTTRTPNISLILGIEIDEPYASQNLVDDWHWSRSYGFIQYTMYAPRRFSPLLRRAIVRALAHTTQQRRRKSFASFRATASRYSDEKTVLEITGPGMFTDAVLDVLSETLVPAHPLIVGSVERDREEGVGELGPSVSVSVGSPDRYSHDSGTWERVTWAPFHRLKEPLWIDASDTVGRGGGGHGGLGVLPIRVWGNGQRHSDAGSFHDAQACVNHRFGRTWKKGWWEYIFG